MKADKKIVSFSYIQENVKSEWVLIGEPELSKDLVIKKGKLLYHSKDRDEVYRKARELKPKHSAIVYTGTLPNNTVVVL